jgi:hypothetical protein
MSFRSLNCASGPATLKPMNALNFRSLHLPPIADPQHGALGANRISYWNIVLASVRLSCMYASRHPTQNLGPVLNGENARLAALVVEVSPI